MVALGPKALAALGAPHPDNLTAFLPKLAGDSGAELFPAGNSDLLLFVKSPNAETAAAGTAAFLAAAGPALHDVQTTGAHHQLLTCLPVDMRHVPESKCQLALLWPNGNVSPCVSQLGS